jgi:hypothetical protein
MHNRRSGAISLLVVGVSFGFLAGFLSDQAVEHWQGIPSDWRHGLDGAALGVLVALIGQPLWRSWPQELRVTKVTAKLPEIADIEVELSSPGRTVAWHLFIELATRVSTQPLDPDGGDLSAALASLYRIFDETRKELKTLPVSRGSEERHTVEYVALLILNGHLRPFLSRWHPHVDAWKDARSAGARTPFRSRTR